MSTKNECHSSPFSFVAEKLLNPSTVAYAAADSKRTTISPILIDVRLAAGWLHRIEYLHFLLLDVIPSDDAAVSQFI